MMDQAVRMAVAVIPALVAFCPCPALTGPLLSHEHITCSTEVYVRVNLEFEECQNNAINNFTNNDSGGNPCPLIKKIVGTCADNVKVCFDEQGWERGQKIFFDQLALQYPQINQCNLFNATDLTEGDPGQKCSIAQEVANGREVADCTNKLQLKMVHSLVEPAKKGGGRPVEPAHFREVFCTHLMEIKRTCLMAKLPKCYEGHVLNAHAAYLLEALKVTSILVALHLDTKGDTNTNVASCPVFVEEEDLFHDQGQPSPPLLRPRVNGEEGTAARGSGGSKAGLVVAVVVLSLVILVAALGFSVVHFRLGPRLKATVSRVPYMDFLTNEQRGAPPNNQAQSFDDQQRSRNDSELQVQGSQRPRPDVTT